MPWNNPERISVFINTGFMAVTAIVGLMLAYWIFSASGLSDDVRAVTSRIDQIYPTLVGQASDIGAIKGSLEVSAQKIGAVADSLITVSERLEATTKSQELQTKNIDAMTAAVRDLTESVAANQSQLDAIAADVRKIQESAIANPDNIAFANTYALTAQDFSDDTKDFLSKAGVTVIPVRGWSTWEDVASGTSKLSNIGKDVWIGTSKEELANYILKESGQ